MQLLQMLADRAERLACLDSIAAQLLPGGRVAAAMVEGMPEPEEGETPLLPDVREVDGWVYSSLPLEAVVGPEHIVVHRLRQKVSPAGELTDEPDSVTICTLTADELEAEAAEVGLVADRTPLHRRRPTTTSARPSSSSARRSDGAPRPRALPRPDEHLRRPRQHPLPAAALRVARDRLRLRRRRARASRSTRARTTSSTSAAARTATSAPSPPTWSRPSAPRCPAAVDDGAVLLAVCGGYQLLGESYQLGEETLPGLGLADLRTVREEGPRLIGNVAIETELGGEKRLLAGFENHGGRTYLGTGARPLGRVVKGHGYGNNGGDGLEGVWRDNIVGTYLHGPLLPKNAWLADHLIELALERRYGERPSSSPSPTTSSAPPTRAPAPPPASDAALEAAAGTITRGCGDDPPPSRGRRCRRSSSRGAGSSASRRRTTPRSRGS